MYHLTGVELFLLLRTLFDVFLCQNFIGLGQVVWPQHFEVEQEFTA